MFGIEFRPLTFEGVYGLSVVKKILRGNLKTNTYDSGYLFVGPYSSGKTTISRLFARSILCENRQEDMSPCNKCSSCLSFLQNRHTGYLEIDAANNGTKDKIKEIKEVLKFESITGKKIILFDEAQNITRDGKDALLLQLETQDPNIILIFCTTELDKMPSTIRSRCCDFHFQEPTEKDIILKLIKICEIKEFVYEKEALHIIIRSVGRHFRDAENKLHQISMLGPIDIKNTKSVVNLYDEEIIMMLSYLSDNLNNVIRIADKLVSKMNVRFIYGSILRIINDSIKAMNGIEYESSNYTKMTKLLGKKYGNVLYELLDYILNKDKLNDITMFQSDLLIIHYKFLKGGFKFKSFNDINNASIEEKKEKVEKKSDKTRELLNDRSLEPWQREDKLRELKKSTLDKEKSNQVEEGVSKLWGPEKMPHHMEKKKLTKDQFREILGGGSIESDRI